METIGFLSITINELRELVYKTVSDVLDARAKNPQPAPSDEHDEELLTRKEVAALLHVTVLTLRNWERRGVLRPRRISRRVLYVRSEVLGTLKRMGR